MKQLMNAVSIGNIKQLLKACPEFMKYEDGYLDSVTFTEQMLWRLNVQGLSVNDIVKEIKTLNGIKV